MRAQAPSVATRCTKRGYAGDLGVDGDQIGQKLLGAERAQGVSTLKLCQMQCHVAACLCEGC
jgi:hypothetical protein